MWCENLKRPPGKIGIDRRMCSDTGRKISIVAGDDGVGHCEKKVHMNMCLNVYRDTNI
jgi:hypothetical protein